MTDGGDSEAAAALAEIDLSQERVIDSVLVPRWYWWLVGLGMVAVGASADTARTTLIVVVAVAYALTVAAASVWFIGGRRQARVHPELLGQPGALAIVAFVWLVVGGSLGLAFGLRSLGFGYPATAATVVGGLAVIVGGPALMAVLRRLMLANRASKLR